MDKTAFPPTPYVPASKHPQGLTASQLHLVEGGAIDVAVPWKDNVWWCPFCEEEMLPGDTVFLAKPPKYAHLLYDIVRHNKRGREGCGMSFAPRMHATVLRR